MVPPDQVDFQVKFSAQRTPLWKSLKEVKRKVLAGTILLNLKSSQAKENNSSITKRIWLWTKYLVQSSAIKE